MQSQSASAIHSAGKKRIWKACQTILLLHVSLVPVMLNVLNASIVLNQGIRYSYIRGLKSSLCLYLLEVGIETLL